MGAPIFRYGDSRLYGHILTKPHHSIHKTCFKNFSNPVYPNSYKIVEYAIKLLKAASGVTALLLLSPLTLMGRISQITHYHALSNIKRSHPKSIMVNGINLPKLEEIVTSPTYYHGTNQKAIASICRNSFNFSKEGAMGRAIYVTDCKQSARNYGLGGGIFAVKLNVDSREIATLRTSFMQPYGIQWLLNEAKNEFDVQCRFLNQENSLERFQASIQELFLKNGYRAIDYQADAGAHSFSAVAVYDDSIIDIERVKLRKGLEEKKHSVAHHK